MVHAPWPFDAGPPDGMGLCMSGGGYRAMLFHLGALVRLNQLGQLRGIRRVSSVSGGSITAALLGLRWCDLRWDAYDRATNLDELVITPLFHFGGVGVDTACFWKGTLLPWKTVSGCLADAYDRHLFHGATLQDLPDDSGPRRGPRFVIDSTNLQTGKQFRFSKPYMGDYTIGIWQHPTTTLAVAVAASSSFPPFFSPHRTKPSGTYDHDHLPHHPEPEQFLKTFVLSDGGVYDNLGLQTVWSNCHTVLVSDAGQRFKAQAAQPSDWLRQFVRVADVIDSQVRSLRKVQLVDSFLDHHRAGAYWSVSSDVADYGLPDPLPFEHDPAGYPANVPTRLTGLPEKVRRDLVRWGYVICDTALRRWVLPTVPRPTPDMIPYEHGSSWSLGTAIALSSENCLTPAMSDAADDTAEIEVTVETEAVDVDGDGIIDIVTEVTTTLIDVDGDGIADVVEQTTITAYDVDGDGTPDLIESVTVTGADLDGDGTISEDEMAVESIVLVREDLVDETDADGAGEEDDAPA